MNQYVITLTQFVSGNKCVVERRHSNDPQHKTDDGVLVCVRMRERVFHPN